MSRVVRNQILQKIELLEKGTQKIGTFINGSDVSETLELLMDCQDLAIAIGTCVEELHGFGTPMVSLLEEYCEKLYAVGEWQQAEDAAQEYDATCLIELNQCMQAMRETFDEEFPDKKEIVFFPYKASMWDSLESVWKVASKDPEYETYVVPIPYYDKNPNGTLGELHYEGKNFPKDVPIIYYEDFEVEKRKPDVIFIHNAYDDCNRVTSVKPRYYAKNLKKYTDCLAYVPYFLFPKDIARHLIVTPALFYADCIFVQNEQVKKAYMEEVARYKDTNDKLLHTIYAVGTPKTDKMYEICRDGIDIPETWIHMAEGKKKVFLNTNLSLILSNKERFVDNLERIFQILLKREDVFVIWREHPLTYETLKSMCSVLLEPYEQIKSFFVQSGLGVFDTHPQAQEAIYFSDCYFGAGGSLVPIYAVTGKPMLVTAYKYPDNILDRNATTSVFSKQMEVSMHFSERYSNMLDLFLDNLELLNQYKAKRYEFLSKLTNNIDGTVGTKIMQTINTLLKGEK